MSSVSQEDLETVMLPLAPLWQYCEMEDELSISVFAEIINCERKSVYRWAESGGISLLRAEEISDYLKVHPTLIWGESYYFACHEHQERKQAILRRKYERQRKKKQEAKNAAAR